MVMVLKNIQLSYFSSVSVYSVYGIKSKFILRHANANLGRLLLAHTGVVGSIEQEMLQYMHTTYPI